MNVPAQNGDTAPAMLELRGVSKRFDGGRPALDGIDLSVRRGETLALVGESGSGKTTLLRLLNRVEEPSAGELRREGRPLREQDAIALRHASGYVQQEGGLLPHWTVRRNVELVPELLGWERERRRERSRELLELVGLDPGRYGERYPRSLSGGQQQRVAFARALAVEPPVLLLDEPFAALDPITRVALHDLFVALRRRFRTTTVLVTHDLDEAFALGDRVAVLRAGRLRQCDTPQRLAAAPADAYVERLLAHRRSALGGSAP